MTYKLAPHVTEEMLKEVGFMMKSVGGLTHGTRGYFPKSVYVIYKWRTNPSKEGSIMFNLDGLNDDITPYIQDLISLGYVVEV